MLLNPLKGTLKLQSNGLLYNNTVKPVFIARYNTVRWCVFSVRVARCLSACLSHSSIVLKRLNISPQLGHTNLVFLYQTSWQHSDEDPLLTGMLNAGDRL